MGETAFIDRKLLSRHPERYSFGVSPIVLYWVRLTQDKTIGLTPAKSGAARQKLGAVHAAGGPDQETLTHAAA